MAVTKRFWFNGECSMDYGIYTTGSSTFVSPSKVQDKITVPGRDGDLVLANARLENFNYQIKIGVVGKNRFSFEEQVANINSWLFSSSGYCRLEDEYHPDIYRMARVSDAIEFDVVNFLIAGESTITFDCQPHAYLKEGENAVTAEGSTKLFNPTRFVAKPVIYVTGTGTINIGNVQINVIKNIGDLTIDCDLECAYGANKEDRNSDIELNDRKEFPVLYPGENGIQCADGMSLEIIPRWWRV